MRKLFLGIAIIFISLSSNLLGRVIVVDPHGDIKSIQTAINLAANGDTVEVRPGTYEEQVILNKDILVMGSGYESTSITGSFNPTVEIKAGVLQWFLISSLGGNGVKMGGGIIRNCVIRGSAQYGIYSNSGVGYVKNCNIINSGSRGIYADRPGYIYVVNCISWENTREGYYGGYVNVSYSIGSICCTQNNQNVINKDPQFTSEDNYHIGNNSPAWDSGNPSLSDPDGSRSDMGYFGGPHCPIYPVVTSIKLVPLSDGGVKVEATGRANY